MLCVNYLHLLLFSLVVLLWEPPLCWSGRVLLGCALGSSPRARECCTRSCPGKSSPSLPARGGSAGPSAEAVLQDKWRNHRTCLESWITRGPRDEHHLVVVKGRATTGDAFHPEHRTAPVLCEAALDFVLWSSSISDGTALHFVCAPFLTGSLFTTLWC